MLAEADAVYVARSAWSLPFLGTTFDVERVLKGPAVDSLRVKVAGGGDVGCGVTVDHSAPYVLQVYGDEQPALTTCNSLNGEDIVGEAISVLGEGTLMPGGPGPPLLLLTAGVALAGSAVALILWIARARKTPVG